MLVTTIGYEKRLNKLIQCIANEDQFASRCLDLGALPAVPPYWRRMRMQNQHGTALPGILTEPAACDVSQFRQHRDSGALVLDCRQPEAFGGGHVPGALNVGLNHSFPVWAGSILPAGGSLLLVLDRPDDLWTAAWHLLRIGYDVPLGWLAGGMTSWRTSGNEIAFIPQWTVRILDQRRTAGQDGLIILDVRQPAEWRKGHVPGARHIPGAELMKRHGEVPKGKLVAVYCASGYRSAVAASVLKAQGHTQVCNVLGGFTAWKKLGLPTAGEQE